MSVSTRSQKLAQEAHARIAHRKPQSDYITFAKKFPALVHTCGLVQAVAFAQAKDERDYLSDLAQVLTAGGHQNIPNPDALAALTRGDSTAMYMRLTRDVLDAAVWLKRYVEAAVVGQKAAAKTDAKPEVKPHA
jgi:CRISPR-associated protein Cmr5